MSTKGAAPARRSWLSGQEAFTQLGAGLDALLRGTNICSPMLDDSRACISYAQQALPDRQRAGKRAFVSQPAVRIGVDRDADGALDRDET